MKQIAFTLYNASAGSGKTYTLTKEYLKILLESPYDDAYKKILAITFTNKAVEEMKTRIVNSLFEFSKEITSIKSQKLLEDLASETKLSVATIKEKSKAIIKNIIHNYSAFGISTIDKFTLKVIRSFAQDLNLPSNFEVTLDTNSLLQEAVDYVISQVGDEEQLTQFLVDFTKSKTDDDKSWDISRELYDIATLLTKEINTKEIQAFKDKKLSDFVEVRTKIEAKIDELTEFIKAKGKEIFSLIETKGIDSNSFQSYFVNHLISIVNFEFNSKNKKYFEPEDIKIKSKSKDEALIEVIKPEILGILKIIYNSFNTIDFYNAFLTNLNPLSLLNTINKEYKKIQEEQNILSISDFNQLIFNQIQDQPAPFIYERLGEKYKHFFIDEFQDTSEMQWKNLIPLIDNALSSEENGIKGTLMLVGDPKQSIYRWRGGKAEQFIDLSKENNTSDFNQNPFSNKEKEVKNLETNYRSYSQVIEFNNDFFKFLATKFENKDYHDLYANKSHQKTNDKQGGYINISFINNNIEENNDENTDSEYTLKTRLYLDRTLEIIQKVKSEGFNYRDIVLLTRKKNEGVFLANFLTENNIPILSSETLLIQNATEVKLLIALLRYLNNNKDNEAKVYFLYYVGKYKQNQKPTHNFIAEIIHKSELEIEEELAKINLLISFKNCRTKSLYEAVEVLVDVFLKEKANTSYIQYFLDLVLEKDSKAQSGITEFLEYWDKTGFTKSIPSPEGADAVKIMTIHKSKGLEFPVVIFPFAEEDFSKKIREKMWVDFDETDINFPKALINSKSEVVNYSEQVKRVYEVKLQEELLDIINVLYVALTRAEEQLFIVSNKITKANGDLVQNNLSYYFIEFLLEQNKFDEVKMEFEFGNTSKVSPENLLLSNDKLIEIVNQKLPFSNIKIAQREALLWGTIQQKAIDYGNVIHEMLANIKTEKDVSNAILIALESGIIAKNESDKIRTTLYSIINHPDLGEFFSAEWQHLNETTILDKDFGNIKPDRIVLKENIALLLDYKTGDKKQSHVNQVNSYALALEKMHLKVAKKVLVYIGENIEVVLL